jgi:hypothetical protein
MAEFKVLSRAKQLTRASAVDSALLWTHRHTHLSYSARFGRGISDAIKAGRQILPQRQPSLLLAQSCLDRMDFLVKIWSHGRLNRGKFVCKQKKGTLRCPE